MSVNTSLNPFQVFSCKLFNGKNNLYVLFVTTQTEIVYRKQGLKYIKSGGDGGGNSTGVGLNVVLRYFK